MRAQTSQAIKSFDGTAQAAANATQNVTGVRNTSSSNYQHAKAFLNNAANIGGMEPIRRKTTALH